MHAGKPILGSYTTGHDPVKEAACGVTARPGDYSPLVDAIKALLANDELREKYSQRARAYFDANHDFRVVARSLVRCIFKED